MEARTGMAAGRSHRPSPAGPHRGALDCPPAVERAAGQKPALFLNELDEEIPMAEGWPWVEARS